MPDETPIPLRPRDLDLSVAEQVTVLEVLSAPAVVTPALARATAEAAALWGTGEEPPQSGEVRSRPA